jgi:hypothetical protein
MGLDLFKVLQLVDSQLGNLKLATSIRTPLIGFTSKEQKTEQEQK